jgi:peptide/nickel transport system substrate-binding protein
VTNLPASTDVRPARSRRAFLRVALGSGAATLLAACTPAAPTASPTQAPAKPAAAPPTQVPASVASPGAASSPAAGASPAASPAASGSPAAKPAGSPSPAAAAPPAAPAPAPAAAAAGKPGGLKVYRVGLSGDATEMDPLRSTTQANHPVQEALYNYAARYSYHPPLSPTIVPELAEGWEVQDGARTYVFHVRKGIKYHDGNGEVTAEDVKWNWERAKDPKTGSSAAPDWAGSTLTVLDPYTIKVTFERPYPSFIGATIAYGGGMIVSPKAHQAAGDKWNTGPVGSGPFMWESAQAGSNIILKRNPNYWGTQPKIDQIQFRMKVDDRTALLAVAKGELDAFYVADPDVAIAASKNTDPNVRFVKSQYGQSPFTIWFNMRRKPLDDIRVRQALRYAIDANAISRDLFGGLAEPIHSFLPPWMFGYTAEGVPKFEYNPDKARQLLKEANVPADWKPSFVSQSILTISRRISEAVSSYWTDVGVQVQNDSLEQGLIASRNTGNNFDMWGTYISRVDPDQLMARFWRSDGATNRSGYAGADDLIDKIRNEADPTARAKQFGELQAKLSEDSPAAFVVATSEHLLLNKRVAGEEGPGWLQRLNWFDVDVPAE